MKCPACEARVSKPAREGGLMIKGHVRVTPEGKLMVVCKCGSTLEHLMGTGRLVLRKLKAPEPSSSKSSEPVPPIA